MTRPAWISFLSEVPRQRRGLRALQICIGIELLFRVLTELPFASYLWGPHGVGQSRSEGRMGLTAVVGRLVFSSDLSTKGLVVIVGVLAAMLVAGIRTRAAAILLAFFIQVLESRLPELADGGDNVTRLVLIYMCFMLSVRAPWKPGSLLVWFHNMAVVAIVSQLLLLYLTSGMMKVRGDIWYHGFATYAISNVDWFSLPSSRPFFHVPLFVAMTSYVPMFYQVMFPAAVLAKNLRLPWILVGAVFHVGVAVTMGLVTFTMAMIGLELFFLTDADFERLATLLRRAVDQLVRASRKIAGKRAAHG